MFGTICLAVVVVFIIFLIGDTSSKMKKSKKSHSSYSGKTMNVAGYGYTDKVVVPPGYNGTGEAVKFYVKDGYLCSPIGIDMSWSLKPGESLSLLVKDNDILIKMDSFSIGYVEKNLAKRLIPIMDSFVDCIVLYCGRSSYGSSRSSYDDNYIETPTISVMAFFNKNA